jgi:CDP-glucose 4,6-dehydratase
VEAVDIAGKTVFFSDIYRNRRILLTGHTGFKGSWLALWLTTLGAEVTGLALDPDTDPNHWNILDLKIPEHRTDIRDAAAVESIVRTVKPEIVFHLAAQSLVRRSYQQPAETWAVNTQGTVHVLEACRAVGCARAIVAVTTDKCYENRESENGYREDDRLGGHDPYSASKAAAELVISSYRDAFFKSGGPLLASARAGNVIGGGDWAADRLIPDLIRARSKNINLDVRAPHAVRPWQHVLEPLAGYLQLGAQLLSGDKNFARAWNFGPPMGSELRVADILGSIKKYWPDAAWRVVENSGPHETATLRLDSTRARRDLKWQPVWSIERQIEETAAWYKTYLESGAVLTKEQLHMYQDDARKAGAAWAV